MDGASGYTNWELVGEKVARIAPFTPVTVSLGSAQAAAQMTVKWFESTPLKATAVQFAHRLGLPSQVLTDPGCFASLTSAYVTYVPAIRLADLMLLIAERFEVAGLQDVWRHVISDLWLADIAVGEHSDQYPVPDDTHPLDDLSVRGRVDLRYRGRQPQFVSGSDTLALEPMRFADVDPHSGTLTCTDVCLEIFYTAYAPSGMWRMYRSRATKDGTSSFTRPWGTYGLEDVLAWEPGWASRRVAEDMGDPDEECVFEAVLHDDRRLGFGAHRDHTPTDVLPAGGLAVASPPTHDAGKPGHPEQSDADCECDAGTCPCPEHADVREDLWGYDRPEYREAVMTYRGTPHTWRQALADLPAVSNQPGPA